MLHFNYKKMADSYALSALKDELYTLIKERKELSFDELKKWMKEKGIGYLSLYAIVEELSNKEDIGLSEKKVTVELSPILAFNFPQKIFLKAKEEKKLKVEKKKKEKKEVEEVIPLRYTPKKSPKVSKRRTEKAKRHKAKTGIKPLIELIPQPRPEEKIAKKAEKETIEEVKETAEEKAIKERIEEAKVLREKVAEEEEEKILEQFDEDTRKAIVYLNSYWSVGSLRFMQDLRRMGVKDPRRLMLKLAELGFIEIVPDGVVNATPKLPKVGKKITLADLLGLS